MEDLQKLIVEFEGPEEKLQELLAKLEELLAKEEDVDMIAVTFRKKA